MPASGKGKEISKPELGEAFFASQSDKKDKVSWSPPPPRLDKTKCGCRF
jgi:hypothetical protein